MEPEPVKTRQRWPPCSVPNCKKVPNHSSFILPKDPAMARQWLDILGIKEYQNRRCYVCEAHFEDKYINKYANQRKHLNKGAIPLPPQSQQAPQQDIQAVYNFAKLPNQRIYTDIVADVIVNSLNCPSSSFTNISTSTTINPDIAEESSSSTFSKRKQRIEERQLDPDIQIIEPITIPAPSKTQSKSTDPAVKIIVELQKRIEIISQVSDVLKQLALTIHLTWPQSYQILRHTLSLPSVFELKSVFDDCSVLTDKLFANTLKYKVSLMSEREKQCFISLGEIEVQEHLYYNIKLDKILGISDVNDTQMPKRACKALMLTVQGLFLDWKQPVAIAYVGSHDDMGSVQGWITRNIIKLQDIGFIMTTFLFKTDASFTIAAYDMNPMFDIPSLFELFYYNFLTHDIVFNGGTAKLQHIIDYYEIDSKKKIRLSPNLTKKAMTTRRFEDINIQLVTDVINTNTAAAMSTYLQFQALHNSATYTVLFITEMNTLFEVLCDNTRNEAVKSAPREKHIEYLHKMLLFFDTLKVIDIYTLMEVPKRGTFVEKFQTTIRSVLNLYKNVKFDNCSENLPVQRFTLDYFKKFNDQFQKSGMNTKPTCREIHVAYRKSAMLNILRPTNKDKCLELEVALDHINGIINDLKNPWQKAQCASVGADIKINSSEYNTLDLTKKDVVVFMAGYLLKKCNDYHVDCAAMKSYICIVLHDTSLICKNILNDIQKGVCVVPPEGFIEFVEMMEIKFRSFMTKSTLETKKGKLISGLLTAMQLISFPMPCECFPILYAKKLYSRLRIYYMLKQNNSFIHSRKFTNRLVVNNF